MYTYIRFFLLLSATITLTASFARVSEKLPVKNSQHELLFVENKGQITDQLEQPRPDIHYKVNAPGMDIFIGNGALHYQWNKVLPTDTAQPGNKPAASEICRMDVVLVGANKNARLLPADKQTYREFHYPIYAGDAGISCSSYQTITYKDIYPKIDWVLYIKDNQLKYDFVIHPGGEARHIQIRYEGANKLAIENGSLVATTAFGSITEQKPYSYLASSGKMVPSSFVLQDNILGFDIAASEETIVIDPALGWATYYGGINYDATTDLCTDASGNVYMSGYTSSPNNIATTGAYISTFNATTGYFVKFNAAGVRQWASYYYTQVHGIAADQVGDIYITGYTYSAAGHTTPGAHQTSYGGGASDAYLAKFDANGQRLWATLVGGNGEDYGNNVTVAPNGDIYLSGSTFSTNMIATPGGHQENFGGGNGDFFLSKFNNQGVRLWGTYYGGSRREYDGTFLGNTTCDATGNVYLCGFTNSFDKIATANSFKPNYSGTGSLFDKFDAFLVKFSPSGVRQWATYYGDTSEDMGDDVVCDAAGNVYLGGMSEGTVGIATPGTFMPTSTGSPTTFLAKFDGSGNRTWGTYTQAGTLDIFTMAYDGMDRIYLTGVAATTPNIATPGSPQPNNAGVVDAVLLTFNTKGQKTFGTYFGGPQWDDGSCVAVDNAGNVFLAGNTSSTTGIATAGAHQTYYGGGTPPISGGEAFLTKYINNDTLVNIASSFTGSSVCQGVTSINVPYIVNQPFRAGNVFTVQLSDATGSFATPVTIGTAAATTAGNILCTIPTSTPAGGNYKIRITATAPVTVSMEHSILIFPAVVPNIHIAILPNDTLCAGDTALLYVDNMSYGGSLPQYQWQLNGTTIAGANGTQYQGTGLATGDVITCILTSNAACISGTVMDTSNTIQLTVLPHVVPAVTITASPDTVFKQVSPITFTASVTHGGSAPTYQWLTNGSAIPGATSNTYVENNPQNNQQISLHVTSNAPCALPDTALSNTLTLKKSNGIGMVAKDQSFLITPNPNKGDMTISGTAADGQAVIHIYNYTGQQVFEKIVFITHHHLQYRLHLTMHYQVDYTS